MFPVRYFSSNSYSELGFGDSSGDLAVSFIEGDLTLSCFLLEEGGRIVFSVVLVLYVYGDEAPFLVVALLLDVLFGDHQESVLMREGVMYSVKSSNPTYAMNPLP